MTARTAEMGRFTDLQPALFIGLQFGRLSFWKAGTHPARDEHRATCFFGYRHYDQHGIKPLFPFGFGLSYMNFAFDAFSIDNSDFETDGTVGVSLDISNSGTRAGSTVVQLNVAPKNALVKRPAKQLKAFAKVALAAGEKQRVTMSFDARAFAYLDVDPQRWLAAPDTYRHLVGTDAMTTVFCGSVTRSAEIELRP